MLQDRWAAPLSEAAWASDSAAEGSAPGRRCTQQRVLHSKDSSGAHRTASNETESVGRCALPSLETRGPAFTAADSHSPGGLGLCHLTKERTRSPAADSALGQWPLLRLSAGPPDSIQRHCRRVALPSVVLPDSSLAHFFSPSLAFSAGPLLSDFQWSRLSGQSLRSSLCHSYFSIELCVRFLLLRNKGSE